MWVQLFKRGSGVTLFLILTHVLWAQDVEIALHATETIPLPNQRAGFIISPIKCDEDRNIFIRSPDNAGLDGGLILKISPNGDKETRFESASVPELLAPRLIDFSPAGSDGGLYALVKAEKENENQYYIVRFDSDGQYQSKYSVPSPFHVQRIVAFPNGDFFVSGRKLIKGTSQSSINSDPFVGIFDAGRQLVREVHLKGDVRPNSKQRKESARKFHLATPPSDREYESALTMSSAMVGGDGNVYLTRRTPTGPVFAISAGGRLLRTIHLEPPQGAVLHSVQVGSRDLAAEYRTFASDRTTVLAMVLEVIDLRTGKRTAKFQAPTSFGSFACHPGGREFVFLHTSDDEKLNIVYARPE